MDNGREYTSGHIRVIQKVGRHEHYVIVDEDFSSRKDLLRLFFRFKGLPVEAIIRFDEPVDIFSLGADLESEI
jgi:hypothetical protein